MSSVAETTTPPISPSPSTSPPPAPITIQTRAYQQELLQESLQRNIIIALDTGSGKTHIAILRMKHEIDRGTKKVSPSFESRAVCPAELRA